jgi:hypothetical protein
MAQLQAVGQGGTPGFFVNGRFLSRNISQSAILPAATPSRNISQSAILPAATPSRNISQSAIPPRATPFQSIAHGTVPPRSLEIPAAPASPGPVSPSAVRQSERC